MDYGNGWVEKNGSSRSQDQTIMERIMLRFRPIAPKPVAAGSVSGLAPVGKSSEIVGNSRKKRKYVRVKQTRCIKDKKKVELENEKIFDFEVNENKMSGFIGFSESGSSINLDFKVEEKVPWWKKLDNNYGTNNGSFGGGGVVDQVYQRVEKVVESWMMVEGVSVMSDVWFGEVGGLGCTDMEKMKNLEMDSCPGLISDGFGRVQWVNLAYRKLVDRPRDDVDPVAEVVAWLMVKEKLPLGCQAFACTVRVVYSWRNNNGNNNCNKKKYVSQTMPCDVWRMDFGGFAWRLDSKAALTLGLN
ncbi:hypothetical protein LIER_32358 [Lithospermum erythrorhizon]|uniref:DUF7950 domain-containing protein n=1 Tax=Lithospermum erythrorhizon TaxID=34254 RepID=A0AAV3RWQ8_LITER